MLTPNKKFRQALEFKVENIFSLRIIKMLPLWFLSYNVAVRNSDVFLILIGSSVTLSFLDVL